MSSLRLSHLPSTISLHRHCLCIQVPQIPTEPFSPSILPNPRHLGHELIFGGVSVGGRLQPIRDQARAAPKNPQKKAVTWISRGTFGPTSPAKCGQAERRCDRSLGWHADPSRLPERAPSSHLFLNSLCLPQVYSPVRMGVCPSRVRVLGGRLLTFFAVCGTCFRVARLHPLRRALRVSVAPISGRTPSRLPAAYTFG